MTTSDINNPTPILPAEPKPRPEWVNVQLAAHMNVYAQALSALLQVEPRMIYEFWREIIPSSAMHRNAPSVIDQIQAIAAELAADSDIVVGLFLAETGC